jgi:hypothetical protein
VRFVELLWVMELRNGGMSVMGEMERNPNLVEEEPSN